MTGSEKASVESLVGKSCVFGAKIFERPSEYSREKFLGFNNVDGR
jgi:hypothetical protein